MHYARSPPPEWQRRWRELARFGSHLRRQGGEKQVSCGGRKAGNMSKGRPRQPYADIAGIAGIARTFEVYCCRGLLDASKASKLSTSMPSKASKLSISHVRAVWMEPRRPWSSVPLRTSMLCGIKVTPPTRKSQRSNKARPTAGKCPTAHPKTGPSSFANARCLNSLSDLYY
jgi:hypothetical protein